MKKNLLLLFLMVLPFFVSSCSDEDGDWDPMKWKTEVKKSSDDYFHVPPQGGTYVFYCTNYSSFWVVSATEKVARGEEKSFSPNYDDNKDASITTDWLTAKSEGNILTVTIQPTTLDANRFMKVEVEAGDVFDEFYFKQRGLKVGL